MASVHVQHAEVQHAEVQHAEVQPQKIKQKFKFTKDNIMKDISNSPLKDETKSALFEWVADNERHSYYEVTFGEILQYVWMVGIHLEGDAINTFYQALDYNMSDAVCKCFTGRIGRLINSLSGLSPLVNIKIGDNEQISNIMVLTKKQLENDNKYTTEAHRELVRKELTERGYEEEKINTIITTWIIDEEDESENEE
jgi:hypothetical protein